jgi:hypothetical protein
MIKEILNLLMMDNHYGVSETIEIAKGKYELPNSWTNTFNQIKRDIKWMIKK